MSVRHTDERGSALLTALFASFLMLALALALLAVVDTQTKASSDERTRDRGFNLAETVLSSEGFVLGRDWPEVVPATAAAACSAGFGATMNASTSADPAVIRLVPSINADYGSDGAYAGATWQANVCDNTVGTAVWDDGLLTTSPAWDANGDGRMWIRATSTVAGKVRTLAAQVELHRTPALDPRYTVAGGGLADDLGSSVNSLTNQGVLGGVTSGLLGTTPTVASDPSAPAGTANGITAVRCGVADLQVGASPCITGTLAATGNIPLTKTLVTGGKLEGLSGTTVTAPENIDRLRRQAKASGTYVDQSDGTPPRASVSLLNGTDTAPDAIAACTIVGTPDASKVVFIEQVGKTGVSGTVGGPGDQYCAIDVSTAKAYKALVVASGRVVIRGSGMTTASTNTSVNTFNGVVYALNQQRLAVDDGGRGLGDGATPGREVLRVDKGAHIRGGINADGKSGRIGIYPPPLTINTSLLVDTLVPCVGLVSCSLNGTLKLVTGGVDGVVNVLLQTLSATAVTNALLGQLQSQRQAYGSAVTTDLAKINAVTVYGGSNLVPGTFRDLQPRV